MVESKVEATVEGTVEAKVEGKAEAKVEGQKVGGGVIVTAEVMYQNQAKYFLFPINSNFAYKCQLGNVTNPADFAVKIKTDYMDKYEEELGGFLNRAAGAIHANPKRWYISADKVYTGMPVLVRVNDKDLTDGRSLARGEIKGYSTNTNVAVVYMVDHGGVVEKSLDTLYAVMSPDLLRIPRLAFQCQLSEYVPSTGLQWAAKEKFEQVFKGESILVTFLDYYPALKSYDVSVEVDKANLAVKLFHAHLAQPAELTTFHKDENIPLYPLADYTGWIGMKVLAFSLKLMPNPEQGAVRCYIQLQPELVNVINEQIAHYIGTTRAEERNKSFKKDLGTRCLALYGDSEEYYRAYISKIIGENQYEVCYVDYGDTATVKGEDLLALPENLSAKPEGATVCRITDFLYEMPKDMEKLKEYLQDKDVHATIDAYDPAGVGLEVFVSLFQPDEDWYSGKDKSFADIFEITQRAPMIKDTLQDIEPISEQLKAVFLQPNVSLSSCYPGLDLKVSYMDGKGGVWVQALEKTEAALLRISCELQMYYENIMFGEDQRALFENNLQVGMFVATKDTEAETEGDKAWGRGKIKEISGKELVVEFIDYGNEEKVMVNEVYPLHSFFSKDPIMATKIAFVG